jgi:hypothetical protein
MATKKVTNSKIKVKIARFGEVPQEILACKGTCLGNQLQQMGIDYNSDTTLYVNGAKAFDDQELKAGDVVLIVGKKAGGNDEDVEPVEEESTEVADEVELD